MGNPNILICWEENDVKILDMIKDSDRNSYFVNLLQNPNVNKHSIFVIPCYGFMSGIWLWKYTHENNRIDFSNFFEEYGKEYIPPIIDNKNINMLHELEEKNGDDTKYGWISPEGKYFHCGYQGHISMADKICFGMIDTNNSEYYLEEHGWCKIFKSLFEEKYHVYVGTNYVINAAQMETLIKLGLDNAEDLSKMLSKDRR